MKRNDAEQIGKLIRSFLRQESLESPLNERRLINSWAEVLGPVIASYTRELYIKFTCIRSNDRSQNFCPRVDEPPFIQRRLQTLLPQKASYQFSYLFCIIPFHASFSSPTATWVSTISEMLPFSTRNIL